MVFGLLLVTAPAEEEEAVPDRSHSEQEQY
jgi:hypothetical protein